MFVKLYGFASSTVVFVKFHIYMKFIESCQVKSNNRPFMSMQYGNIITLAVNINISGNTCKGEVQLK